MFLIDTVDIFISSYHYLQTVITFQLHNYAFIMDLL